MPDLLERLGATLGDSYSLEGELAGGGMSRVFIAQERALGRRVVVKVLPPELAAEVSVERFRREVQVAARLAHPHIVPVLAAGEADGLLYYTMPFVGGESLKARLERERQLPVDESLQIAREVAGALDYAHREGVVHRDVKPANILLQDGHAVVADFGIARALQRASQAGGATLTSTGLAVGTPQYMSPEQASGEGELDGRSDVYSLGCVLYEMLAGEPPFTGRTPEAVIAKRFAGPPVDVRVLRPLLPQGVDSILERALATVRADRFATAADFARALDGAAPSLHAARPAWRRALGKLRGRGRSRIVLAAAGVVTLAAAGATIARMSGAVHTRLGDASGASEPAESPAGVALDPKRVLVAAFENRTGDAALDPVSEIATHAVARGLGETKLAEVVDARTEAEGTTPAQSGAARARAVARRVGAGSIVWGSYFRRGDSLEVEAQLTDAATGRLLASAGPAAAPMSAPATAIERVKQQMMVSVAAHVDPRFADFRGASLPKNYEAFEEFLAGDAIRFSPCPDGEDCFERKLARWRRAYQLDTSFTLPAAMAAGSLLYGGTCPSVDSIGALLSPRKDVLAPFDRAVFDVAMARCHGDQLAALEARRRMVELNPHSTRWRLQLAFDLRNHARPREALAVMAKVDERGHEKNLQYWGNLSSSYHQLGMYDRELQVGRRAVQEVPDNWNALLFEIRALAALGRIAEVNALIEQGLRIPDKHYQVWGTPAWLSIMALELRAHGHPNEARAIFGRVLAWYHTQETQPDEPGYLALLLYHAGRYREAQTTRTQLTAKQREDLSVRAGPAGLGAMAARLGDRRSATREDQWLAVRHDPNGAAMFERARIAALLGDRERAIQFLRQAYDQGSEKVDGFDMHIDPDFEALRDDPRFRELTRPKG